MAYKILIGHAKECDYYEDTKGNTYSYDGKKVRKLMNKEETGKYSLGKELKENSEHMTKMRKKYAGHKWTKKELFGYDD